jgi:hypothetical protein
MCIDVELDDVEAHEYHKAQLVAERGFRAAEAVLQRLANEPETVAALGIALVPEEEENAADFSYLSHLQPFRLGRYLKIAALLLLGGLGMYLLR